MDSSCRQSCLALDDRQVATECFIELCHGIHGKKTYRTHHMKQKTSTPLSLDVDEYKNSAEYNHNYDNLYEDAVSIGYILHIQGQARDIWNRKITTIKAERKKRIWAQSLSACITLKCSGVPVGTLKDVCAIARCHDKEKWQ